jgi:hypothetical protein
MASNSNYGTSVQSKSKSLSLSGSDEDRDKDCDNDLNPSPLHWPAARRGRRCLARSAFPETDGDRCGREAIGAARASRPRPRSNDPVAGSVRPFGRSLSSTVLVDRADAFGLRVRATILIDPHPHTHTLPSVASANNRPMPRVRRKNSCHPKHIKNPSKNGYFRDYHRNSKIIFKSVLTADGAWCKLIVLSLHKGVRREAVAARVREG